MKTKFSAFHINTLGFCLLASIFGSPVFAQGTAFTYQGRLNDGANPASGGYDLTFSLWNAAGGPAQIGGTLTNANTAVSNGLFTVTLDFGNQFPGADRWLEIGVRTNGAGVFVTLTPRQKITPTPYSVMANTASNLLGALPAAQLSGTVDNSQLANNAVNSAKIVDLSIVTEDLAADAVTSAKILDGTIVGADLANNTVGSAQLADVIALGTNTVHGRQDVYHTTAGTASISLIGNGSQISTYGSDGLEQIRLWGPSYGELLLNNSLANNATAVRLTAQGSTGGQLELKNTNGVNRAILEGENTGGTLTLYQGDGNIGAILYGNNAGAGSLSLRNTNGSARLVANGGPASGSLYISDSAGTVTFEVLASEFGNDGAQLTMRNAANTATVEIDADFSGAGDGEIRLRNAGSANTVTLDADASGRGRVTTEELQITSSTVSLTNNATLDPSTRYARISGSGGAVTLNAATAIANGSGTGSILILEGTSDSNTVTIPDAANTVIGVNRILGLNDTLTLIWNGADWVQLAFSNN